ncbi:RNA-directed DNA polymerase [Vibrio coralliilyticus]|uniref:RNA-directed DNA polymerase n=1 Tax=Vibrio coralliilyticus TaxID=190893 RepID=UPI001E433EC0|nr:RNA-directed DNA polymerase [Vibrio coralliilyticus]MCC2525798.1 RNA-directed DNA polymerase [Vibrio coralliilyticus]
MTTHNVKIKLASELMHCAKISGNSEQKASSLVKVPQICLSLAENILSLQYQPQPYQHFAVTEPKLREIYAPSFQDRIAQMWVVSQLTAAMEKRMIDDTYANRKGKGSLAAITKTQKLMRQPKHKWGMQLDIYSYFNHIDKAILLKHLELLVSQCDFSPLRTTCLVSLMKEIIMHDTARAARTISGDRSLLDSIPVHKRLSFQPSGKGLPIGSVTSQLFGNYYLNGLDHYIKHTLRVKGYVRYMDDLLLLSGNKETLLNWKNSIEQYAQQKLQLKVHPNKVYIGKVIHGFDYLGYKVFGHHKFIRRTTTKTLIQRLVYFNFLLTPERFLLAPLPPQRGQWARWAKHNTFPTELLSILKAMQATINSYYGLLSHANHCQLRKNIYHQDFDQLKRYFIPANAMYTSIRIRKSVLNKAAIQSYC